MAYGQLTLSDTTYAGEVASSFITNAITGAETIKGGHAYVKDSIKKKFTIPRIKVADLIQSYSAKPTSSGTTTIDAVVLEPELYMVYGEFDPQDFADHWFAPEMQEKLIGRGLPATAEAAIVDAFLSYNANYLDVALWQGDILSGSTPYNKFNGFIQKASANADVIDVPSATTLTASNIVTELEKVYSRIPAALLYEVNFKLFVSYKTAQLYSDYQIAQTNKGVDVTKAGVMEYKGKKVIPLPGVPNDVILGAKGSATLDSNMWIGVNSMSDTEIQLGKVQNNSNVMFVKALFACDTQFGFGTEVVLYKA